MRKNNNQYSFTPTDLNNHLRCEHLSQLNRQVADGELTKPEARDINFPFFEDGIEFEKNYLQSLMEKGLNIFNPDGERLTKEETIAAMREGYDVIYQGFLAHDSWYGYSDFLIKTDCTSDLGQWSYEVLDTKISPQTKATSLLQIALYSDLLKNYQGRIPQQMHIVTPVKKESYTVQHYLHYLKYIQNNFSSKILNKTETYPEICNHCTLCDWQPLCQEKRRKDDYLGFVAGAKKSNIKELKAQNIATLEALAKEPLENIQLKKGSKETSRRLQLQAKTQYLTRTTGQLQFELLPLKSNAGLSLLPEPTKQDLYIDVKAIRGNTQSRILCVSWNYGASFTHVLAKTPTEQKEVLENLINLMLHSKQAYPYSFIYHYGSATINQLKQAVNQLGCMENELDQLLRMESFIDLKHITQHAVCIGVESYELLNIEAIYKFKRQNFTFSSDLLDTISNENTLNQLTLSSAEDEIKSLQNLHSWLEEQRTQLLDSGQMIERPVFTTELEVEGISEHLLRIQPLFSELMQNIPEERKNRTAEQQARYLLAHFLDWYRREEKSFWWEYFRLLSLQPEEHLDEKLAIGQLNYIGQREKINRSIVDTYRFAEQEHDLKVGNTVKNEEGLNAGEIVKIDDKNHLIYLKKGPSAAEMHPQSIIKFERFLTKDKVEAVIRFAEWVVENGIENDSPEYGAIREILLNRAPKTSSSLSTADDLLTKSLNWVHQLEHSYLPIQGPPGAGKSYTASRIIFDLIKKKKKVGITALSHKVITNLLLKVHELAEKEKEEIKTIYKSSGNKDDETPWKNAKNTQEIIGCIPDYNLFAGTSFMWCHPDLKEQLDYLFIDEAGQYALIETMVVGQVAKNIVLLGDQQQLKQPIQGFHPEGTELSALEHLLNGASTIPEKRGIFLAQTWRMHPSIASFDSEMFYESRLKAVDKLCHQKINGSRLLPNAGLYYSPVKHEANSNCSEEEVEQVEKIVKNLLESQLTWTDANHKEHPLTAKDIKIITPYNAQVFELEKKLPHIDIGTVDKFQGQEAPIVIYSMATSTPEEAPRGMDFLYSPNRFNVAVSRAQIAFILVGNPAIFQPNCSFPEQVKMANIFCYYLSQAQVLQV